MSSKKQKSPQVVKHVVNGEKWACSTLKTGKNKPIVFVAKTRDFARICDEIKEKRGFVRMRLVTYKEITNAARKHIMI